ncbi:MAG: class I adenylate-forming enzyme family protein [Phaeovulum sp.]|uniref:class I adenylate-forming enzyme family protein n=1 Tax=Phaeovulum sp. TaxID=2934796 RepID=UPI0027301BC5|nr:class I adenylate-forming enzyme family protein [Phaeovulum sp.]MDP2062461.1 class I adenylate-forming enzyme family protein [Phaeovulum sp.]
MRAVCNHALPDPCPAAFNMAAHVLARAPALGTKSALMIVTATEAERWSYARLEEAVRGCATGLLALGLEPGARLLLRLGNTPEFAVAFLGAIAAGLVPVPTSSQLTAPEITRLARELSPALVIAGEAIALPDHPAPVLRESALRGFEALEPAAYAMGGPDRLGYIIYTSGTSGRPRAVMHAHRAIWARRMMHAGWYGLGETDRLLHAGAFNWTYTLGTGLMDPWSVGATALIPGEGVTSDQFGHLLRRYDASIFAAVPGVYRQILKHDERLVLPRLRHGLSAGESLSPGLRSAWKDATGTSLHEALGMSECSTFVSSCPGHPAPAGTIGYPQPGRHLAVLGPDGTPVGRGEPGILAVHRSDPGLFLGYLDAPEETAARYQGDWFVTGDTVTMAGDGAIAYVARSDDMMNAGGYRVSPLEVEAALMAHPAAGEVAAVELRVKPEVCVIAVFYTGSAGAEALETHAAACLARYKQPRIYIHLAALTKNANGKLNRGAMRRAEEARRGL